MNSMMLMCLWVAAADGDFVGPPAPPTEVPASTTSDDPQTLRLRIDQNMKAAEEQIRRQDLAKSKELQNQVLRDIEVLLKAIQTPPDGNPDAKPPPPAAQKPPGNSADDEKQPPEANTGQGPSGGSRSNQTPGKMQPQPGGGSGGRDRQKGEQQANANPQAGGKTRERRGSRPQPGEMARNPQSPGTQPTPANPMNQATQDRPGPQPGEADGAPGSNPDQARGATMRPPSASKPERLSEMSRDVWGHLPETMRQEVDHYYRERFMPRYRELLQQYYTKLAEAERREKK